MIPTKFQSDPPVKPAFLHHCPRCVFLGRFDLHDLYVCPDDLVVHARFDNDTRDCLTGKADDPRTETDPHLGEALRRARQAGLFSLV